MKFAKNTSTSGDATVVTGQGGEAPQLDGNTAITANSKTDGWNFAYLQPGQR